MVFPVEVPPLMSSVFPLRICSGQELCKRQRKRAASNQVIDREMAAGKLANGECGRRPHDWRNHCREAAAIGELRVKQGVVFVQMFAKLIGNHFEAGAEPAGVEVDSLFLIQNPIAFVPP